MCLDSPLRHRFFHCFVIQRYDHWTSCLPAESMGDRDSDPSHPEGNFMSFINDDS
jgi:hypothetical protein